LGGLVQGLAPVLIAVLAVTFLGERPTPRVVAGIVLALAGAGVLAWGAIHVASVLGLVFLFLSAASWATYAAIGRYLGNRVVAVLVAWLALGESLGPRQATGGAIVIAGALLASSGGALTRAAWRRSRPRASQHPEPAQPPLPPARR